MLVMSSVDCARPCIALSESRTCSVNERQAWKQDVFGCVTPNQPAYLPTNSCCQRLLTVLLTVRKVSEIIPSQFFEMPHKS